MRSNSRSAGLSFRSGKEADLSTRLRESGRSRSDFSKKKKLRNEAKLLNAFRQTSQSYDAIVWGGNPTELGEEGNGRKLLPPKADLYYN